MRCVHPAGYLCLAQPRAMADPPGCGRPCATCLLCLYSCQWITAKKEKRKGLQTTKVIPCGAGDAEPGLASPCAGGSEWWLGEEQLWLGGSATGTGPPPGLSPSRAGVLRGTQGVQEQ